MIKQEYGKRLRFFRKKLRISQTKLAIETNIPQTTISDFENGKYLPNIYQGIKLAKALHVSIYDFNIK